MDSIKLAQRTNLCLFCLESVAGGVHTATGTESVKNEAEEPLPRFCLWEIYNYFKVYFNYEILQPDYNLEDCENINNCFAEKTYDYYVLLCHKCQSLAKQMTKLCKQFELLQLQMDYYVKQAFGVINAAAASFSANADIMEPEIQKFTMPNLWRSRELEVKLERCELKKLPPEEDFFEGEYSYSPVPSPIAITIVTDRLPDHPKNLQDSFTLTEEEKRRLYAQGLCPFCSKQFSSRNKAKLHSILQHPEQFLSSAKLDGVSFHKFQSLCQELIFENSHENTTVKNDSGNFGCPKCDATYKCKQDLRVHLINHHNAELRAKLTQLQSQEVFGAVIPDQSQNTDVITSTIEDDDLSQSVHPTVTSLLERLQKGTNMAQRQGQNDYNCTLCAESNIQKIFSNRSSQEKHLFEAHAEYFLISLKTSSTTATQFQRECSQALNHFQKRLEHSEGTYFHTCCICSCTFLEKGFLDRHQIESHYDVLCQRVVQIQEQIPELQTPEDRLKCHHCQKKFFTTYNLAAHLVRSHKGVSSTNAESAKKAVSSLPCSPSLSTLMTVPTGPTGIVPLSSIRRCKYCAAVYTSNFAMNRHMNIKHHSGQKKAYQKPGREPSAETPKSKPLSVKCKYCVSVFMDAYLLTSHIRRNHPHKYKSWHKSASSYLPKCVCCNKQFSCRATLKRHALIHAQISSDLDNERVSCEFCGKWNTKKRTMTHQKCCKRKKKQSVDLTDAEAEPRKICVDDRVFESTMNSNEQQCEYGEEIMEESIKTECSLMPLVVEETVMDAPTVEYENKYFEMENSGSLEDHDNLYVYCDNQFGESQNDEFAC